MKIAFIVDFFPKLSETFILNQITGLLDMGHDVEIFAKSNTIEKNVHCDVEKYRLMERVHYFDIPQNKSEYILRALYLAIANFKKSPIKTIKSLNVQHGKYVLSLKYMYFLTPFLGTHFDIIQCHFGPNGNIGAHLKQIGIKGNLVTMFHGYDIRLGVKSGGHIYDELFKYGDCFLAISNYNHRNLISFGLNPQKIIFHPVGIDLDRFPYRQSLATVKQLKPFVVLTVARLVEEKGLQYGIQSISEMLKRTPELDLEYRIVGGGELEKQLKTMVNELHLGNVVHFLGPMDQDGVMKHMQDAHLFLLPSIAEALPIVLMEAQAVGLPVIATNVGSVSQVMIDGKSGFLVSPKDVDALVEKIEYFINCPTLRRKMGLCGRKFVENKYDVKKLNKKLVEMYTNLIQT